MSHSRRPPSWSWSAGIGGLFLLLFVTMAGWYFWPRSVPLSNEGYAITMALYRVCNQRDAQALETLQRELDDWRERLEPDDPQLGYLQRILDQAQAGDWDSAMHLARRALDQQTGP